MEHILIIGGSKGIGGTHLRCVAGDQKKILSVSRHPRQSESPNVEYIAADITDLSQTHELIEQVKSKTPKLNQIIFFQRYRGDNSWEGEHALSLTATKEIIEGLADHFQPDQNNTITLISSAADRFIATEQDVGYHVAKAGMSQLVRYYAVQLGSHNIRVNGICSGAVIKEEAQEYYDQNTHLKELYQSITPLGRMGTAKDISQAIELISSPLASFITGQCLMVDGGISLQWQESLARKLVLKD